ncbi:AN1-type zinc finger protein 2A isoform X3 [Cotesia typhae]|uniref:AN1-type zinc finger protein 2A isoform X3 n=1 Tax=Cotesia typhae TaxID=2053667 RepID=UPI003D68AEEE
MDHIYVKLTCVSVSQEDVARVRLHKKMELPHIGKHCSEKTCNRLDFLPMKCDACEESFCSDHITYLSHSCPSAYKKDVQVPVCPLCHVPIPIKRGDTPDIAVGLHIDNQCESDLSNAKKKVFVNKCSSKGCKIKEIIRVDCKDCGMNFCLKHRHPVDHNCIGHEEAVRLKRLEALKRKAKQQSSSGSGSNSNRQVTNGQAFRNIQGGMSEDEALARALQASLQDEDNSRRQQPLHTVPSGNRNLCRLA